MAKAKSTSTALAKWDEELAKAAAASAKMEANTGGGQFFSTANGVLMWQDAPLKDNQAAVIILDSMLENVYYENAYNKDSPESPKCYAYGRDDKDMKPHENVVEAGGEQSESCATCQWAKFGTALVGRGKACKNTRRIAMIPAGTFAANGRFELTKDDEHFESSQFGYMKLPVTSVAGYASFVKQVAATLRRPPFGVVTKVKVVPDPKNQYMVLFEPIQNVPDSLMGIVMKRHQEAEQAIAFPYQPFEEAPAKTGPARGRAQAKAPAKRAARKY